MGGIMPGMLPSTGTAPSSMPTFPPTGVSGLPGVMPGGVGGPGFGPGGLNTGPATNPAGTNPSLLRNMNYDPFAEISERGPMANAGTGQLQGGYPQQPGSGMGASGPQMGQ